MGNQELLPDMTASRTINQAVILVAGSGSRLRIANSTILKPLIPIHGKPLLSYTIDALVSVGVEKIVAVVGFEGESISSSVRPLIPPPIEIQFVKNSDWKKQNGISLLSAASNLTAPFFLTMSDHLFDRSILDILLREAVLAKVNLAIDRKLNAIFDLEDAMKVQTRADQMIAIGKNLSAYNAIDTGLFVCSTEIFDYLKLAVHDGDCSLADGVRLMAKDDKVRVIDIGDAWWQDVDTPAMLEEAERKMSQLVRN
jgi:1L-myo-inositol 1-phosphate cytidylyltransferase